MTASLPSKHPFRSVGKDPHERLTFRTFEFTQHGLTDGRPAIRARSSGRGALVAQNRKGLDAGDTPSVTGTTIVHAEQLPVVPDRVTTLHVDRGRIEAAGPRRTSLALTTLVLRSDDPGCRPGARIRVGLTDGHGNVPDNVSFRGDNGTCLNETSTSLDRRRVHVHLPEPRFSP